jgi:hypothetical protein
MRKNNEARKRWNATGRTEGGQASKEASERHEPAEEPSGACRAYLSDDDTRTAMRRKRTKEERRRRRRLAFAGQPTSAVGALASTGCSRRSIAWKGRSGKLRLPPSSCAGRPSFSRFTPFLSSSMRRSRDGAALACSERHTARNKGVRPTSPPSSPFVHFVPTAFPARDVHGEGPLL